MKQKLLTLLIIGLSVLIYAISLDDVVNNLISSSYEVTRVVRETGISSSFRVEKVTKIGSYKLIKINSPFKNYVWLRGSLGEYVIIDDIAFEPAIDLTDLEDQFIDLVSSKKYDLLLSLDLPTGYKFIIKKDLTTFEATFDEHLKLVKLRKSYPFYSMEISYQNYTVLSDKSSEELSQYIFGVKKIRAPLKLSKEYLKEHFQWVAMDFSYNGSSSTYMLYFYSAAFGKIALYLHTDANNTDLLDTIQEMCTNSPVSYATRKLGNVLAILIGSQALDLSNILDSLLKLK